VPTKNTGNIARKLTITAKDTRILKRLNGGDMSPKSTASPLKSTPRFLKGKAVSVLLAEPLIQGRNPFV